MQPSNQRGRVQLLVAGSLIAIAVLWFGAGAISQQNHSTSSVEQAVATAAAMPAAVSSPSEAAVRGRNAIEEMEVTAPRIVMPKVLFEQPASDIALTNPADPKTYWQANES
ncbi:MAG: hypothetical protein ACR2PZ_17915 [Pseudomonadales bacterium]